ncbi:MAG: hypothetical protein RLZZ338_1866 [Cyanobacteriota bacterium]|jgi:hypothetical protein
MATENNAIKPVQIDLSSLGYQVLAQPQEVAPGLTLIATGPDPSLAKSNVPSNADAAITTRANQLLPGGGLNLNATGQGVNVGVWDQGQVLSTHQELTGRVTNIDTGTTSNHATHVAGTIGAKGVESAAKGMAPNAQIRSRDWNNDLAELDAEAKAKNITLSNHSYGQATGWNGLVSVNGVPTDLWTEDRSKFSEDPDFGRYSADSQKLDQTLYNNKNLLSVWAAENERDDKFTGANGNKYVAYLSAPPGGGAPGFYLIDPVASGLTAPGPDGNAGTGYDSLPTVQTAKNSLVVGAVADATWSGTGAVRGGTVLPSSSSGMTDDGRLKVDLVANGDDLYSPIATGNDKYASDSGTSMAAANLTGTMALEYQTHRELAAGNFPAYRVQNIDGKSQQRFQDPTKPLSSTMKGLGIHTAKDLGQTGPDYQYGWGLLDGQKAATFLGDLKATNKRDLLKEGTYTGTPWTARINSNGANKDGIKVTLAWTDPAPTNLPARTLDNPASVLVNDLNLSLKGPDGKIYHPWVLDPNNPSAPASKGVNNRDNVEQIFIPPNSPAGNYTVVVEGPANTKQDFSIFATSVPQIQQGHGWGDVHYKTFDGKYYDFQGVGEFIYARSTVDDWQVQTRQERWAPGAHVSVNKAFATTMDGYNVVLDQKFAPNQRIKIDGQSQTLNSGQSLNVGQSRITRNGSQYTFTYAGPDRKLSTSDDDVVIANDNPTYMNIYVKPADYRADQLEGLLGNADGVINNDFTLRGGKSLGANPSWADIHGQFGESWRITQDESLFGTPTMPKPATPPTEVSLETLDPAVRDAAIKKATEAGIPEGPFRDGAALDFAITGDQSFIDAAKQFVDGLPESAKTVTPLPPADPIDPAALVDPVNPVNTVEATPLAAISLAVSPSEVAEDGTANLVYTFTRTGDVTTPLTVNYRVGGSATFDADYTQSGTKVFTKSTGTITFAEGASTATLTIDPTKDTVVEGNETIDISLVAGNDYTIKTKDPITGTITDGVKPDTTAPISNTFSPTDNATDVAVTTNLVVKFSEAIEKGTGNLVIKKVSDDSVVETIDVTSSNVTVNGSEITIDPRADLTQGTEYYVEIADGAIKDVAGNNYAGISDNTTWNFTTKSNKPGETNPPVPVKSPGVFTVGPEGQVNVDFINDSGFYQGEMGLFSLEGMENLTPGSTEYIKEAARRANSKSELGYVVIRDRVEGAKFNPSVGETPNRNFGDYLGFKNFTMKPNSQFAIMLVPNGTVQELENNPTLIGDRLPLFSTGSNPGQLVDLTGKGNTFIWEDLDVKNSPWSDLDYNDIIFQLNGATVSTIPGVDGYINSKLDWRNSQDGKALIDYAQSNPLGKPSEENIPFTGEIPKTERTLQGSVNDGKVTDATVFFDSNKNGKLDSNEPAAKTDETGIFALKVNLDKFDTNKSGDIEASEGNLVALGGTDKTTGKPVETPLSAPVDSVGINPLTTLVTEILDRAPAANPKDETKAKQDAEEQVKQKLGLPTTSELTTPDPTLADKGIVPAATVETIKKSTQVENLIAQTANLIDEATTTPKSTIVEEAVKAIGDQIESNTNVNFSDQQQVKELIVATATATKAIDPSLDLNTITQKATETAHVIAQTNLDVAAKTTNSPQTQDAIVTPKPQPVAETTKPASVVKTPTTVAETPKPASVVETPTAVVKTPTTIAETPTTDPTQNPVSIPSMPNLIPTANTTNTSVDVINRITKGLDDSEAFEGTNNDDIVYGKGGNDNIFGKIGKDELFGNQGDDYIDGGNDDDILHGGKGNDNIIGGEGNDQIWGNNNNDILIGGEGNDIIYGGKGNDQIWGGIGNDELSGDRGDDSINGEAGKDTLLGYEGDDLLLGGDDDDILIGGSGNNTLVGGNGNDIFVLSNNGIATVVDFTKGDLFKLPEGITANNISFIQGNNSLEVKQGNQTLAVLNGITKPLALTSFI